MVAPVSHKYMKPKRHLKVFLQLLFAYTISKCVLIDALQMAPQDGIGKKGQPTQNIQVFVIK